MFLNSGALSLAVASAEKMNDVIAVTGIPLESKLPIIKSFHVSSSGDGSADFKVLLVGPKGRAKVHFKMRKIQGDWYLDFYRVVN